MNVPDDREQSVTAFKEVVYIEKYNRCLGNYWRQVPALLLLIEKSPTEDSSEDHIISITNITSIENKKCLLKVNASGIIPLYSKA